MKKWSCAGEKEKAGQRVHLGVFLQKPGLRAWVAGGLRVAMTAAGEVGLGCGNRCTVQPHNARICASSYFIIESRGLQVYQLSDFSSTLCLSFIHPFRGTSLAPSSFEAGCKVNKSKRGPGLTRQPHVTAQLGNPCNPPACTSIAVTA